MTSASTRRPGSPSGSHRRSCRPGPASPRRSARCCPCSTCTACPRPPPTRRPGRQRPSPRPIPGGRPGLRVLGQPPIHRLAEGGERDGKEAKPAGAGSCLTVRAPQPDTPLLETCDLSHIQVGAGCWLVRENGVGARHGAHYSMRARGVHSPFSFESGAGRAPVGAGVKEGSLAVRQCVTAASVVSAEVEPGAESGLNFRFTSRRHS